MDENNNPCPVCLGSKKYFTGKTYKDCNVCDENGMVNDEINNLYCGEEL